MIKTSISHNWWWFSHQVVSHSCDPIDCSPPGRLLCPFSAEMKWNENPFQGFSAKHTGVGCHFLQGIFPSQGWNHSPFALQADSLLMNHHGSPFSTIKRPLSYCGLYSVLFPFFHLSSFSPLPSSLSCNISCSVSWIFLLSFMSNYLYLKLSYKRYLKQTVVHLICSLPSSHSSFQSWRNLQECHTT